MPHAEKTITVDVPETFFKSLVHHVELYPEILKDVRSARVLRREAGTTDAVFTIRAVRPFDYTIRIIEQSPQAIEWTLLMSKTLKVNNGGWRFEALSPGQTRVTYWNEVEARLLVPKAIINMILRVNLPSMMRQWESYALKAYAASKA